MNKDIKAEWVACLRDGSYKQGKYIFRDLDDYFDAVGVLADRASLAGAIGAPKKYSKDTGAQFFFGWTYDGVATRASAALCEWAGIDYWLLNRIMTMNDKGMTFNEIADYIEREF